MMEAILGQVYLVTFVAMIVGLLVAERHAGERRRSLLRSSDDPEVPETDADEPVP